MYYIFFCFYNSQYLNGNNKISKDPWFQGLSLMVAGTFCWSLILAEVFYHDISKTQIPNALAVFVLIILYTVHYLLFARNKKYLKIYNRYKTNNTRNVTREKIVATIYLFVPAILVIIIPLVRNKIVGKT